MAGDNARRRPVPSCSWCGHDPHAAACPALIDVRTFPERPCPPVDLTIPCPCTRKDAA